MPYGEVNADKLTYSTATGDVTIELSGVISNYVTLSKVSGTFTSFVSGVTITGATGAFARVEAGTINLTTAPINSLSGVTTASFTSGNFSSFASGVTVTGQRISGISTYELASGSATNPSLSIVEDSDTGFYLSDNVSFSITVSGQEVSRLSASGLDIRSQDELRFYDSDNSNFIGLKAPASGGVDSLLTLPVTDGTSGQALFANGNNALGWRNIPSPLQSGNYQEFSGSSTWTKPSGATIVYVECVGGGGGGGGGAVGGSSQNRCGGGGGAGGVFTCRYIPASTITGDVTITVGAGGSGGSGVTDNTSANGTLGTVGGASSFGSFLSTLVAQRGGEGTRGGPSNSSGAVAVNFGASSGALSGYWSGPGASGFATGTISGLPPIVCLFSAGGGGGGGGSSAAGTGNTIYGSFGAVGFYALKSSGEISSIYPVDGGGSGGSFTTPIGGSGLTYGDGGGGGTIYGINTSFATGTSGGPGGNGAIPGGGGGGGGPASPNFFSGKGGDGARGVVRVWAW